jgi:hypothetical protein
MKESIGKRFRIRYMGHISKLKYEIVAEEYDKYIIGFNSNEEDRTLIKGWPQEDDKYGNKYELFWYIEKNDLIKEKENNSCLEIE